MSRKKVFLYGFVSLIAVAVLVAGGFALYRLGVAHGVEGIGPLTFDRRFMPDFDRRPMPDLRHWRGHVSLPFVFVIPRLLSGLVFIGILALAIYGGIKLLGSGSGGGRQTVNFQPLQPVHPVDDPPSME
jgi:hypothetical protein